MKDTPEKTPDEDPGDAWVDEDAADPVEEEELTELPKKNNNTPD